MSDAARNGPLVPAPQLLQRLVDGAFDRVPSLEPRRPSLFERPTLEVADPVGYAESKIDEDPIRRSAPVGDVAEWTSRDRASQDQARLIPIRWRADDRPVEFAQRERADREHETVDRALGPPAEPAPQPSSEPLLSVRDSRPVPVLLPARIDLYAKHDRATQPIATPVPRTRDASIVAPEPGSLLKPRVDVGALHAIPPAPVPARRQQSVLEPRDAVNRGERHSLHAAAAAVSEPVVNVTIGRVEVRVVPAQPAATRQRPGPPKPMSLDQYLQKRGGPR